MKIPLFPLLFALLATLPACKKKNQPGYSVVKLDQVFELKLNGSVQVEGQDLKLTFSGIPEDSRCPKGVNCIQEGQVRVSLDALHSGTPQVLEFTRKASQTSNVTRTLGNFKIQLNDVSPYPKEGEKIKPEDYRLKLAVRKSG